MLLARPLKDRQYSKLFKPPQVGFTFSEWCKIIAVSTLMTFLFLMFIAFLVVKS